MDLEQYKKAWEKQPEETNKVSAREIYRMTQAKSTSIVKWILIIGLLEFSFWSVLNYFMSKLDYMEVYDKLDMTKYINSTYYINYAVVIIFLYLFYRNYSAVSTVDDTKTLMKKIIRVRRTVKFYVYFNIISSMLVMIVFNIIIVNTPNGIETILSTEDIVADRSQLVTIYIITQAIAVVILFLFLFLFYYLLYGILLRKLKRNYRELTKLEEAH